MSIAELEHALREALEWQKTALKTRSSAFLAACEAVLEAERALAAAKGEPYAVPITFPVIWDSGAPLPHLLKNEDRTFLAFFLREVDPGWDGSFVKVRHAGSPTAQKLAVVEFEQCLCAKMGTPNDEVFHGHPLHGRGFVGYRTMSVENSS